MVEQSFDPSDLAKSSGATYVARGTVYHASQLSRLMSQAISHSGFSFVEVISNCHTQFGRLNREGSAVKMIQWQKECAVSSSAAAKMTKEEMEGKFVTGKLHEVFRPEYVSEYQKIIDKFNEEEEKKEQQLQES